MTWKIGDKVEVLNAECITLGDRLLATGDITKVTRVNRKHGLIYIQTTSEKRKQRDLLLYHYEMKYIKKIEG